MTHMLIMHAHWQTYSLCTVLCILHTFKQDIYNETQESTAMLGAL